MSGQYGGRDQFFVVTADRVHRPIRLLHNQVGKTASMPMSACGKTSCLNTGTFSHRLQHRRATFDEVAALGVEGLNKSAIARVKRIAWNTVHRWLQKAAGLRRRFNDRKTTGFTLAELQADEIRSIVGGRQPPIWIFAAIEGWSHLWPSTVVGTRSYQGGRQRDRYSRSAPPRSTCGRTVFS